MARQVMRVEGLRELDAALGELTKSTARATLRRVLVKAGQPIAERARSLVPVDSGRLRDSIAVSTKLGSKAGSKEFAAAMKAGLGKDAAMSALRGARRAASGDRAFAEMYVGPGRLPHAHMVEFGSINNAPQPYMRPAWDEKRGEALDIVKDQLGGEIEKSARRAARKALRKGT